MDQFQLSDADIFGETSDNDISIGRYSVKVGQWTVLGTLIHELAHVDGAPGGYPGQPGAEDKRAEGALVPCGLGYLKELTSGVDDPFTPYTPGISG